MGNVDVITTAQANAKPHYRFLEGLEQYCIDNNANLIILPTIGKNASEEQLHDYFSKYDIENGDRKLNSNIMIKQMHVRPYQIDPLTGLNRFAQQGTSLIFASPKQRLRAIPHSNYKLPKWLTTTGACTLPNYAIGDDVSAERRRLGNIARLDHQIGALVVDVLNNSKYNLRHLRANKKGDFVDMGIKYSGKEKSDANLEALILGDWHNGQTDKKIKKATYEMIEDLKPQRIFLHDFFDGHSVNHHSEKAIIRDKLLNLYDKNLLSLEDELKNANKELQRLATMTDEVVVVASNHHEFLDRYLEDGKFIQDLGNTKIASKIFAYMVEKDGNIPIEYGINLIKPLPSNVKFLKRDEDYKVRGYQLSAHGDKGPGGGRGNITSKENDFGKSVTGHVHNASQLRNTYTVGTMLPLTQYYTRGQPVNWTASHCAIYDNGQPQLLHIIDGKYK